MSSSPSRPSRKRRIFKWTLVSLMGLAALALIGIPMVLISGRVAGEEFSPGKFERRHFEYVELPWSGTQVFPVSRRQTADDLTAYLITNNLIVPSGSSPDRWDLVWDNRTAVASPDCDAAILCSYLDAVNHDGERYWLAWTRKQPEYAKVLWPIVAELARHGDYIATPDAFEAASAAKSPMDLSVRLSKLIQQRLGFLLEQAKVAGDQERSTHLADRLAHWEAEFANAATVKPGRAPSTD